MGLVGVAVRHEGIEMLQYLIKIALTSAVVVSVSEIAIAYARMTYCLNRLGAASKEPAVFPRLPHDPSIAISLPSLTWEERLNQVQKHCPTPANRHIVQREVPDAHVSDLSSPWSVSDRLCGGHGAVLSRFGCLGVRHILLLSTGESVMLPADFAS